jgi:hypothetical protein
MRNTKMTYKTLHKAMEFDESPLIQMIDKGRGKIPMIEVPCTAEWCECVEYDEQDRCNCNNGMRAVISYEDCNEEQKRVINASDRCYNNDIAEERIRWYEMGCPE